MKKIFFILLFGLLSKILLAQDTLNIKTGPHGGKVKQSDNYNIEILDPLGNIYAFLLNYDLKPVSNKNITGHLTFYFPDDVNNDYSLKPYGPDGFFAECPYGFYSFKVTFNFSNKKISALFDNDAEIVRKK